MSTLKKAAISFGAVIVVVAGFVTYSAVSTRSEITAFEQTLIAENKNAARVDVSQSDLEGLPVPVQAYFNFVFPNGPRTDTKWVEFEQEGQFRRPLTKGFAPTTGRQVVAARKPDLVFSAVTPLLGPIWAVAYDVYISGKMQMEARLLSAVSVMKEFSSPTLDQISLRRWLLESPSFPSALLPGGPVTWEAIDDTHARAVVRAHGYQTSMVASFDKTGALTTFAAEEDGDLTTPYHGSGEHVARGDYQLVDGVRIPMSFEISRAAKGKIYPFWSGRITQIKFIK
ncbi:MAG: hypothetical protein OQJ97_10840 [Rhodospirillales bacterium]|nr:hypothetical protein [Rhodospirillales bacterium]